MVNHLINQARSDVFKVKDFGEYINFACRQKASLFYADRKGTFWVSRSGSLDFSGSGFNLTGLFFQGGGGVGGLTIWPHSYLPVTSHYYSCEAVNHPPGWRFSSPHQYKREINWKDARIVTKEKGLTTEKGS